MIVWIKKAEWWGTRGIRTQSDCCSSVRMSLIKYTLETTVAISVYGALNSLWSRTTRLVSPSPIRRAQKHGCKSIPYQLFSFQEEKKNTSKVLKTKIKRTCHFIRYTFFSPLLFRFIYFLFVVCGWCLDNSRRRSVCCAAIYGARRLTSSSCIAHHTHTNSVDGKKRKNKNAAARVSCQVKDKSK